MMKAGMRGQTFRPAGACTMENFSRARFREFGDDLVPLAGTGA